MKKLFSATLVVLALACSGTASANSAYSEWYGKEGQDESPSYMNRALSQLPAQKAADFRGTMKDSREDNKDLQEQVYQLHGELHAILTAPTFDKDAFLAKRQELQRLNEKMEENRTEAFASAVSELSQNERVTLTRALHHESENHHGHHHMAQMQNSSGSAGEPNASIQH